LESPEWKQALDFVEARGTLETQSAVSINRMAVICTKLNKMALAKQLYKRSLGVQLRLFGCGVFFLCTRSFFKKNYLKNVQETPSLRGSWKTC
jgi:hypothetical protein